MLYRVKKKEKSFFNVRYLEAKRICPNCQHKWCVDLGKSMLNLKKVQDNFFLLAPFPV